MDIEDQAPLREMVEARHISPVLKFLPCIKKKNQGFRYGVRASICAELGVKIPVSE